MTKQVAAFPLPPGRVITIKAFPIATCHAADESQTLRVTCGLLVISSSVNRSWRTNAKA